MSRFLLDTQIFIWFAEGDGRLPQNIKRKLMDSENEVFFSAASAWEMAIKVSVKKIQFREPVADLIRRHCESDFTLCQSRWRTCWRWKISPSFTEIPLIGS